MLQGGKVTGAVTSFVIQQADGSTTRRLILEENLSEDGARVVMVGNGREAVDQVMADGPDAFDIVLMDLQMPPVF